MEKYPYLAEESKAKSLSLVLLVACALCTLLAVFVPSVSKLMTCLAAILACVLLGFAMHYLDFHNVQGQSIKKYVLAFHLFAIHAILTAFGQFTGGEGTFSHLMLWGLADAALMAGILALVNVFKPLFSKVVLAVVALVTFLLTLFGLDLVSNILFIIAAVLLVVFSFKESLVSALYGVVVAILVLLGLINKSTHTMHHYLHYVSLVLPLLAAYGFYKVVDPNRNDVNLDINRSGLDTRSTVTRSSLGSDSTTTRTSSDISKASLAATGAAAGVGATKKSNKAEKETVSTTTRSTKLFGDYVFDRSWFIVDYKDLPYEDLLNSPVYAFKGVSEEMAEDLKSAFGIKTIGELADSKYFAWAKEIVEEANK